MSELIDDQDTGRELSDKVKEAALRWYESEAALPLPKDAKVSWLSCRFKMPTDGETSDE